MQTQKFAGLKDLVGLARGVISIPAGVREEIIQGEKHRLISLLEKRRSLAREWSDANIPGAIPEVDVDLGVSEYTKEFDAFVASEGIDIIPYAVSMPSMEELFRLAAKKMPPFDKDGQSFRDAVIAYSVKEVGDSKNTEVVILVTEDRDFRERTGEFFKGAAEVLTLKEAEDRIDSFLDDVHRLLREDLAKAVEQKAGEIGIQAFEEFAKSNASFEYEAPSGDTLLGIKEFKAESIHDMENLSVADGIASYTMNLDGHLVVAVRTLPNRSDVMLSALRRRLGRPRKVGDIASEPPDDLSRLYGAEPIVEERTVPMRVVLRCQSSFEPIEKMRVSDVRITDVVKTQNRTAEIFRALHQQDKK